MSIKNTLTSWVGSYLGDKAADKGIGYFTEKTVEATAQGLKSKLFGMGEADEVLTLEAASYALKKRWVSKADVIRIFKILAKYKISVRNKVTNIIGDEAQKVSETTVKDWKFEKEAKEEEKESNKKKDPKGRKEKKKQGRKIGETITSETIMVNIRGARVFQLLSKMKDDEIMAVLKGSGSLDTFWARLAESMEDIGGLILFIMKSINPETCNKVASWLEKQNRKAKLRRLSL